MAQQFYNMVLLFLNTIIKNNRSWTCVWKIKTINYVVTFSCVYTLMSSAEWGIFYLQTRHWATGNKAQVYPKSGVADPHSAFGHQQCGS